jgi:hypothetical protein
VRGVSFCLRRGRVDGTELLIGDSEKRMESNQGYRVMIATKILVAIVLLLGATSITLAQSQENCAPGAPIHGDCFGQPFSGSAQSRCICPHYGGYYRYGWRR